MLERGIKFIVLSFAAFMHYVATMLVFFVPIDVAHKMLGAPQFFAILFGTFVLWLWSMATAVAILKSAEKK